MIGRVWKFFCCDIIQESSQAAGAANNCANLLNIKACRLYPQGADTDSPTRRCGTYRHPTVHAIACLRHVYAVYKVALAIKQGASGNADLSKDTQGLQRFLSDAVAVPALPTWVCSFTHLKPDVLLCPSIIANIAQDALQTFDPAERSPHSVTLPQVSFTSDTKLHHRAVDKSEQHCNLRQSLLQSDRGTITVLPLMVALKLPLSCPLTDCKLQCGVEHRMRLAQLLTDLYYAANKYPLDVLSARHRATRRFCTRSPSPNAHMPSTKQIFTTTTRTPAI